MGSRLVCEELGGAAAAAARAGGGGVPVVEVDPFGEATEVVWMLALLFRLEPKPKLLKRELMTSTVEDIKNRRAREGRDEPKKESKTERSILGGETCG
jgi:hypothetical protein